MKRCVKCGHESEKEGKFCKKCGEEFRATVASSGSGLKGSLAGSSRPASARASEPGSSTPSPSASSIPPSPSSSSPLKGSLFSKPTEEPVSVKPPTSSSTVSPPPSSSSPVGSSPMSPPPYYSRPVSPSSMGAPLSGSSPVTPPPMTSPPMSPPPMTPPPGYPGASRPRSPLLKVLLGIVGVVAVVLITIGVMRFLSDDAQSELEIDVVYEEVDEEIEEEEVEEGEALEAVEEDELTPLTAREVYDANVDAVFTIFLRVPEYWNMTQDDIIADPFISYPLFLPTGNYIPTGSGFFVNSEGVAITNHHVVVEWDYMVIRTHDGEVYPVLGYYSYDIDNDIAIIQVEGSDFPYTTFTEIPIAVADYVYAIGSSAGDPNTFTSGVVSRFAQEIQFGIYTVTDMIQFTAPIYGGNSGGPLFNQYGQVVGIVSAADMMRASVGFAVRIERVDLDRALRTSLASFPLGGGVAATATVRDYYDSFSSVPTLESVSGDVIFFRGGAAADLDLTWYGYERTLDAYGYERTYMYSLLLANPIDVVNLYDDALWDRGFIWQEDVEGADPSTMWYYFYHPSLNISVTLWYLVEYDMMIVAIGRGNIHQDLYGSLGVPRYNQTGAFSIMGDWREVVEDRIEEKPRRIK